MNNKYVLEEFQIDNTKIPNTSLINIEEIELLFDEWINNKNFNYKGYTIVSHCNTDVLNDDIVEYWNEIRCNCKKTAFIKYSKVIVGVVGFDSVRYDFKKKIHNYNKTKVTIKEEIDGPTTVYRK